MIVLFLKASGLLLLRFCSWSSDLGKVIEEVEVNLKALLDYVSMNQLKWVVDSCFLES